MDKPILASVKAPIRAPVAKVWNALVTPAAIERYMFGAKVVSDWKVGAPIVWKGVWDGKAYEDKGVILRLEPERVLQYTHFSPLSGLPDTPENHHTVTVELSEQAGRTLVPLTQDNNPTEGARQHSEKNWSLMLEGMRRLLEE